MNQGPASITGGWPWLLEQYIVCDISAESNLIYILCLNYKWLDMARKKRRESMVTSQFPVEASDAIAFNILEIVCNIIAWVLTITN